MTDLKIVKMSQQEIDGICAVENECFSTPWSRKSLESELENQNALFFAAVRDNVVLGYVGCILVCGEASITNVAVLKSARRQKVASSLIEKLVLTLKENKAESVFLEVRKSNEAAKSLYAKFGFSVCAERKNFYREPCEDAYIMKLTF